MWPHLGFFSVSNSCKMGLTNVKNHFQQLLVNTLFLKSRFDPKFGDFFGKMRHFGGILYKFWKPTQKWVRNCSNQLVTKIKFYRFCPTINLKVQNVIFGHELLILQRGLQEPPSSFSSSKNTSPWIGLATVSFRYMLQSLFKNFK